MKFPPNPDGYRYRPLKRPVAGWDVYALQTCLKGRAFNIDADGYFGPQTESAVKSFQRDKGLTADGIAGVLTQRALVLSLLFTAQKDLHLPTDLLKGHVEAESSFWVGNHSPRNADDGKYDLGLVMQHLPLTDDNCLKAFHGPNSLFKLADWLRQRKDFYFNKPGAQTNEAAWRLAVGSWNAPAWASTLANGGSLTGTQQDWFNNYVERCIVYVTRWDG